MQEKFYFEILHKDKERVLYQCRVKSKLYSYTRVLENIHTCIAPLISRSVASNQKWLQASSGNVFNFGGPSS